MTDIAVEPRLRVVGCQDCERLQRMLDAALIDIDNTNVDLMAKRRRITWLENELGGLHTKSLVNDPLMPTAQQLYAYWKLKCAPKARTFSEDRQEVVLARLHDVKDEGVVPAYPPRYIAEAIFGAYVEPYVDGRGKTHNDLTLICRTGGKLENFHERYDRWKAPLL